MAIRSVVCQSRSIRGFFIIYSDMAQESNVAFDIVLESAKQKQKPIQTSPRTNTEISQEKIEAKLQNAEDRRKVFYK